MEFENATLEMLPGNVNHDAVIHTGEECGNLYLRNFDKPHNRPNYGYFPEGRPWFMSGGYFFASPEAALAWLKTPKPKNDYEHSGITYTGYGANTHAPCGN